MRLSLAGVPSLPFCSPGAAPWGKRGWKMFHTLLRGMVLYFLKVGRGCTALTGRVGKRERPRMARRVGH